jgi:tripeptidyl-peptidase-1
MEADIDVSGRDAPAGWIKIGAPRPGNLHKAQFVFKHDPVKQAKLEKIFWEVSNPKHPNYGKYLTWEEVASYFAAPESDIAYVQDWLQMNGASDITLSGYGDTIEATLSIEALERMLNTKFAVFKRLRDGTEFTRIVEPYYVPEVIAPMLALVGNLLDFPGFYSPRITEGEQVGAWPSYCGSSCTGRITPKVILQQYNVTQVTTLAANSSVAVAEFQSQHYDQTDLNAFTTACNMSKIALIDKNGGNEVAGCNAGLCTEALLDIEYLGTLAAPIPIANYYYKTYSLLDWINGVLADPKPSLVHSVSYGNDEIQQTSQQYMYQCNDQFMAAGTRGITILFASGDQGVWGRSGHNGHFNPDFPAGSPYVTAIGGSDFTSPNLGPETCCQDSGGGFSVTFARPSYQDAAVTGYLKSGVQLPTASNYNATGRAYPDLSAIFGLAVPYCISSGGRFEGVAGTSASSPVVASMFGIMNNIQFNAKKPALGFVNQWIYQLLAEHPDSFYDVTTGVNNGGSGQGFYATKGWDPCSGAGTVNFENIVKYLP